MSNLNARLEAIESKLDIICLELGVDMSGFDKSATAPQKVNGKPVHHATAWSSGDDTTLLRMYKAGESYVHIGAVLGRTEKSCQVRRSVILRKAAD